MNFERRALALTVSFSIMISGAVFDYQTAQKSYFLLVIHLKNGIMKFCKRLSEKESDVNLVKTFLSCFLIVFFHSHPAKSFPAWFLNLN